MKYKIKNELLNLFNETDCIGVSELTENLNTDFEFFAQWIQNHQHSGMKFLEKNWDVRKNPVLILNNAKTALVFLFPYTHGHKIRKKNSDLNNESNFENQAVKNSLFEKKLISKYVYSKDYHKILKKKLAQYAIELQKKLNLNFSYRAIVDSAPFFERAYGRQTGLGFIGKNTLLIRPGMGSFFFIGTILTDLDISMIAERDDKNHAIFSLNCGDCQRCLDACPTQALETPYTLNANKCISYLTIEHREIVPTHFLKNLDRTIYGCDICQDVCPYNFVTQDVTMLMEFKKIHTSLLNLTVKDVATMTETQYQQWFGGTAMTRAKYAGLVRNALYYLHANHRDCLPNILEHHKDSPYPLIKATVQQILSEMI